MKGDGCVACTSYEVGQLLNVLGGSMSFVGTRPEVPKYVARYTPEMMATLLLPAGVTSEASIRYKDEAELLDKAEDVDETYVQQVLPGKMAYNLASIGRIVYGAPDPKRGYSLFSPSLLHPKTEVIGGVLECQ